MSDDKQQPETETEIEALKAAFEAEKAALIENRDLILAEKRALSAQLKEPQVPDWQQALAEKETALREAQQAAQMATARLESLQLDQQLRGRLLNHGVLPEALEAASLSLQQRVQTKPEDQPLDALVSTFVEDQPFFFRRSSGSGAFGHLVSASSPVMPDDNPFLSGDRAARAKLRRENPELAAKLSERAETAKSKHRIPIQTPV